MRFSDGVYDALYERVFLSDYAGYKPEVQESPAGNATWDTQKKYAHVATKYSPDAWLMFHFDVAFGEALRVYKDLGFPDALRPDYDQCCLRILDYPPGASSAEHTDFDFMTLQLYRDRPEGFVRTGVSEGDDAISHGVHFGEIAELAGLRPATPHRVRALPERQRSVVFFVLPSLAAPLGDGTVGEWLKERYARSRR